MTGMRKWLDKPFMSFIALSICCAGCGRTNEQKQHADEQTVSGKKTEALA